MDTSSHVCMGVATGILISSIASQQMAVNTGSIIAISVIANTIPDIDVVMKLKSNAAYINNHRGATHSVLFTLFWMVLLSVFGFMTTRQHLSLYIITAVVGVASHIGTDLLNGYGVQFLWPFNKKWIALGITYTFDAYLISSHLVALVLILLFRFNSILVLTTLYVSIGIYIFVAFLYQRQLKKLLKQKYGHFKRMILQSKSTPQNWKYVYETTDKKFYMGTITGRTINQLRYEKRLEVIPLELEKILYQDKAVRSFINFTPIYNYHIKHDEHGITEIKYYDLRYLMVRKGKYMYQFNCIVRIKDQQVLSSYIGFVVNEETIYKKIDKKSSPK